MSRLLLEAAHVSKSFPGVRALDDVSIAVHSGEVLALVGHNGSGKSTLVKILAGVYAMDVGRISTSGGVGAKGKPEGLHFIHQDLGLVPMLSTIENIDLSRHHGVSGWGPAPVHNERMRARQLIAKFSATFDVDAPVSTLTPAERTIVAIARALDGWTSQDNVLVLDEPTAALQGEEVRKLFEAIRAVIADGAGVILISHRLDEVVELADRVVVLRDGRLVADEPRGSFDRRSLVSLVAGAEESTKVDAARHHSGGQIRLSVIDLYAPNLRGLSIDVRAGEIIGVTGLIGSGMEQIGSAVFGRVPRKSGHVLIDGKVVRSGSPAAAIRAGMGFVPADRRGQGSIVTMNARENLTLPRLSSLRGRLGQVRRLAERAEARRWMDEVGVRPVGAHERPFSLFSGGNQQKIVLAKWIRNAPRVLVLEEPTQGVDVAAQAAIHELIAQVASDGAAILVASTDTKELVSLCHRVVVLHDGRETVSIEGGRLTESALVRATLEVRPEQHRVGPFRSGEHGDG
jgi:ABC-type sugar transport system ATPase subunit